MTYIDKQLADREFSPEGSGKNPFIVKFGGGAGKAVRKNHQDLAYVQYSQDLQVEDTLNEWAPFLTRIDWEVARWAKLRGPSSTALSELLGIDGVACPHINLG